MYNLATNVFKIAHSKTGRTFFVKMIFSSGLELSGADCEIFSMKISRGNENADDITFGDVSSAIATIEMSYDSTVISSVKEGMNGQSQDVPLQPIRRVLGHKIIRGNSLRLSQTKGFVPPRRLTCSQPEEKKN